MLEPVSEEVIAIKHDKVQRVPFSFLIINKRIQWGSEVPGEEVVCFMFLFVRGMDGNHASKGEENRNICHKSKEINCMHACIYKMPEPPASK